MKPADPATRIAVACAHDGRHEHGTTAAYRHDRCRCQACTTAAREYQRDRRRAKAYGRTYFVPAAPVREHLARLLDSGLHLAHVHTLSGLSSPILTAIYDGTRNHVTRRTAARLAAVTPARPTDALDRGLVDSTGPRRRIQALATLGWHQHEIATHAGISRATVVLILRGRRTVNVENHHRIADAYDRMWSGPPEPATANERVRRERTRSWATAQGWAPPLAWDDDCIDDPTHQPTGHRAAA